MIGQTFRRITPVLVAVSLIGTLSACANPGPKNIVNPKEVIIIDVRTPQEFASGHLTGSINIDINAADFDQKINALNPTLRYLIYCRSGNRSAQALVRMQSLGFDNTLDLGSVESASESTGVGVTR
jgi:rhodanese-related sulfurtransferase